MQMYSNEYIEGGQHSDKEKKERRKKKHHKSRDDIYVEEAPANGGRTNVVDNGHRAPERQPRHSEEENFEPGNETRRKHRHRRNKAEETEVNGNGGASGGVQEDEVEPTALDDQEEARRARREKKRRARDRKNMDSNVYEEQHYGDLQSPSSTVNGQPEPFYDHEELPYDDHEPELMLDEEEEPEAASSQAPKPKKKTGGFRKIFASFKRKGKGAKAEPPVNDHWQSNPELFNPAYDSQPGTLEKTKKKIRGKAYRDIPIKKVHVILLDGEEVEIEIDLKATGNLLFAKVCESIDLIEKDFFGMTYVNPKLQTWFWLEFDKKISKQLGKDEDWTFNFQVKFYPPEPILLQEDLTRYLLSLQVRQDVFTGKLPCSWITQALLGSFMVQSELGDYDETENGHSIDYLREFEFVLNQSEQLLEKICELHKKHIGMSPDRADIKYMETAKRLEQYGVDLHPARDNDDVEIFIGVSYQGILIYRDRLRIGRFAWPKVIRISYKKNYFYLKIRSDRYDDSVAIVGFKLFNHHLAKRLWKNAAEQHTFFRMKEPQMTKVGSRLNSTTSSSSGYNGKTLHQYRSMTIARTQPVQFDRSLSKRRTLGSMPAGLDRAGVQYSSMHSLNRLHPRDMTLGKTKSIEHLSSKRSGSAMSLGYDREGSVGSQPQSRQIQPPPYPGYGSLNPCKDDDRHQSFRSGDSLNGGDSYTVNHDDQISLPSMSIHNPQVYANPIKKHRTKVPSIDALSDDGIISSRPRDKIKVNIKPSKMVPLPLPPDSDTSDSDVTESVPKPITKKIQPKQSNQNYTRPMAQFKPPSPLPEPPSQSSSVRSSPVEQHMPPPPPSVDLHSYTDNTDRATYNNKTHGIDRSRPPPVKPKPTIKPKPVLGSNERAIVTKSASRRRDGANSNDDML